MIVDALIENLVFTANAAEPIRRSRRWSADELDFLTRSMGYLTEGEIAALLGRPKEGVHLKREKMGLPATSKTPGWTTALQAGYRMGLDGRYVSGWVRMGLVMGHILGGPRKICMVYEVSLRRFVLNPMNWPRFDANKVQDPHLRRLLARQRKRWGDEWLTARQVEAMTGLPQRQVNQYVQRGQLPAVHVPNMDGRGNKQPYWSLFFIRRSDAQKMRIYRPGERKFSGSPAALEWIRKALGMGWKIAWIARSMKRNDQTVRNWIRKWNLTTGDGKAEK